MARRVLVTWLPFLVVLAVVLLAVSTRDGGFKMQ
jgi:hypothetical protein